MVHSDTKGLNFDMNKLQPNLKYQPVHIRNGLQMERKLQNSYLVKAISWNFCSLTHQSLEKLTIEYSNSRIKIGPYKVKVYGLFIS